MSITCVMLAAALSMGGAAVQVDFSREKWNTNDWTIVKGPHCDYCHGFIQRDGCIENEAPDLPAEEVFKKHVATTYSGMVLKDKFSLGATVSTTTGWDWKMAPLIVIAPELGVAKDGKTPEFREHWEIVVYDEGINIWHHFWTPDKGMSYVRSGALVLPADKRFKANERHTLSVQLRKNFYGHKALFCTCEGYTLQCIDDSLPETFYAGIIGCEGRNFFWDFSVKQGKK